MIRSTELSITGFSMKSRYTPFFAALLTTAVTFGAYLYLDISEQERLSQKRRVEALHQLGIVKAKLEGSINTTISLTYGMVAYISTHHDIDNSYFELVASGLMVHGPHIRNIGIAKDNVINLIYPLKGNEKALGLNYLENHKQRDAVLRAIKAKKTVVAGPVNLVQGGVGIISRTPIYLTPPGQRIGSGRYWGMASVVINMDPLFESAGVLNNKDLKIAIKGKDSLGADGDIFFGDETVFRSAPVILDVLFPEGSWQMAATPVGGWSKVSSGLWWLRAVGAIFSILSGVLVWFLVRNPVLLRRKIEEVTEALVAAEDKMREAKEHVEREERNRLARELHDGIGQSLLAMKLNLQMLKAGKTTVNTETLAGFIEDVSSTTEGLRDIVANLRPSSPEADIASAVRQCSARMRERSGVRIMVAAEGGFEGIDSRVRENIYRIYQEALNNAIKHSGADRVEVKLSASDKNLLLEIKDNGKGFNPEDAEGKGSGLSIMRERAELLKGVLKIEPAPGKGTSLYVEVPV